MDQEERKNWLVLARVNTNYQDYYLRKLSCSKIYPHHDIDIVFSFKPIQNFVPFKKPSPKSTS
jgi:hypothetical protein